MKKLFFLGLLSFVNVNSYAAPLATDVLAERSMHVSFAPEQYRGIFKFQLLTSGIVQKVDNKNNITYVAQLSETEVAKVRTAIDNIKSDQLIAPTGPLCMDFPMQLIQIQQSNSASMTIWKNASCRISEPSDENAAKVAKIMNDLNSVFTEIEVLNN